jgi:hypothetical protein
MGVGLERRLKRRFKSRLKRRVDKGGQVKVDQKVDCTADPEKRIWRRSEMQNKQREAATLCTRKKTMEPPQSESSKRQTWPSTPQKRQAAGRQQHGDDGLVVEKAAEPMRRRRRLGQLRRLALVEIDSLPEPWTPRCSRRGSGARDRRWRGHSALLSGRGPGAILDRWQNVSDKDRVVENQRCKRGRIRVFGCT